MRQELIYTKGVEDEQDEFFKKVSFFNAHICRYPFIRIFFLNKTCRIYDSDMVEFARIPLSEFKSTLEPFARDKFFTRLIIMG